jgi:hypothetical protein
MPVGTALARIMHHSSRFCPPSPRPHAFDPSSGSVCVNSLWNALGSDLPRWWLVAPWLRDRMASGQARRRGTVLPPAARRQLDANARDMRLQHVTAGGKLFVPALDDALRLGPGGTVGNPPLRVDHNVEATRPHAHRRSIRGVEPTIQPMGARCTVLDPPHAQNPDPVLILTGKSAAMIPPAEREQGPILVEAPKPRLGCALLGLWSFCPRTPFASA